MNRSDAERIIAALESSTIANHAAARLAIRALREDVQIQDTVPDLLKELADAKRSNTDLTRRLAALSRRAEADRADAKTALDRADAAEAAVVRLGHRLAEARVFVSRAKASSHRAIILDRIGNESLPEPVEQRSAEVDEILTCVADHFGIRVDALVGPRQFRLVSGPRNIAAYLIRKRLGLSFPCIAKALGRTNHTTAMTAVRCIERDCGEPEIRSALAEIDALLSRGQLSVDIVAGLVET